MSPTPPPGIWHRPVRRWQMWAVLGAATLLWLLGLAVALGWVYRHGEALVAVREQPLRMDLPTGLHARAAFTTHLQTRVNARPRISVPIDQMVSVELTQQLSTQAQVQTRVPVDTQFDFDDQIPVQTEVAALVPVRSWLPPVPVKLPVKLVVPVRISVPVHLSLPLALNVVATGRLDHALQVPVQTRLTTRVPINAKLDVQLLKQADFELLAAGDALSLRITRSQARLPLHNIQLLPPPQPGASWALSPR